MSDGSIVIRVVTMVVVNLAFMVLSVGNESSRIKSGDGFYVLVNGVPQGCKGGINGHYCATKEGKLSFPFMNDHIADDRDIGLVREDLEKAIQRYCHQRFPGRSAFPMAQIISDAEAKHAGDQVLVMGQARKPGIVRMRNGLTVYQAIRDAGGPNQFGSMRHVAVLRGGKIIECDLTQAVFMNTPLQQGDVVNVPLACTVEGVDDSC